MRRVPHRVGDALLHDAPDREAQGGRDLRVAAHGEGRGETGLLRAGDGLGGSDRIQRGERSVRLAVPEHAQHRAHLAERVAGRSPLQRSMRPWAEEIPVRRRGGALRQRDHHGERVRHDVVHLARDALALRRGRELRVLVALDEQLPGAVDDGLQVALAVADVDADEGSDQAHRQLSTALAAMFDGAAAEGEQCQGRQSDREPDPAGSDRAVDRQ